MFKKGGFYIFSIIVVSILEDKKIKKSDLALKLGVSRQSVNSILSYYSKGGMPTFKVLKKWAIALDVDIKIFFE